MPTKVFLFDDGRGLLVDQVEFDHDTKTYTGWVLNGFWTMEYHVPSSTVRVQETDTDQAAKHIWIGDPSSLHYKDAIDEAWDRYKNGEAPNYDLVVVNRIDEDDFEEDIPY